MSIHSLYTVSLSFFSFSFYTFLPGDLFFGGTELGMGLLPLESSSAKLACLSSIGEQQLLNFLLFIGTLSFLVLHFSSCSRKNQQWCKANAFPGFHPSSLVCPCTIFEQCLAINKYEQYISRKI
jgi:hypothetical protein